MHSENYSEASVNSLAIRELQEKVKQLQERFDDYDPLTPPMGIKDIVELVRTIEQQPSSLGVWTGGSAHPAKQLAAGLQQFVLTREQAARLIYEIAALRSESRFMDDDRLSMLED